MTKYHETQQKMLEQKYLNFCKSFCVEPISSYKELIRKTFEKETKVLTEAKKEALCIYYEKCESFNVEPSEYIENQSTCYIWDDILRITNQAVEKEFGNELAKIKDIVFKNKMRATLQELYDQNIYIKTNEAAALFACVNNNEAIVREFHKLGGSGCLPHLNAVSEDEEEIEEEVNKYEENY